ncbi:hypothetical protein LOTGIDRAFT_163176 [Lottia gigantea]|uniref:Uncharacterized protein n=1 Tax=Lottia gigantea TaxID=225164 RepID=V4A9R6_LOTGI|nr:hypothetical protein LOTGIDRAFT_163176 [Lottia gigantea]ESO91815.1 hypothetical protein LOTGIDRAFT_163176 [Lottia gigantea]
MLRTRFYSGLRADLKLRCGHKYDATKNFEDLVVQVRCIEHELQPSTSGSKKEAQVKATSATNEDNEASIKVLTTSLQKLTSEFTNFRNEMLGSSVSVQQHQTNEHQSDRRVEKRVDRNVSGSEEPSCFRCGQTGICESCLVNGTVF